MQPVIFCEFHMSSQFVFTDVKLQKVAPKKRPGALHTVK